MSMDRAVEYAISEDKPPESTAPERSPAYERPDLTGREREVAALVAQGFTNRRISEELFVSRRTVDHHVSNILKKLGLHSREQIASHHGDH